MGLHFLRLFQIYLLTWALAFRVSSSHTSSSKKHSKFAVSGPILTVTVQEPGQDNKPEEGLQWQHSIQRLRKWTVGEHMEVESESWIPPSIKSSLSSLSPSLFWSIRSTSSPLPNIIPTLRSASCTLVYRNSKSTSEPYHEPNIFAEDLIHGISSARALDKSSPLTLSTHVRFSKRFFPLHYLRNPFHFFKRNQAETPHSSDSRLSSGIPISLDLIPTHHLLPPQTKTNIAIQLGMGESVHITKGVEPKSRLNLGAHLTCFPNKHPLVQSFHASFYSHRLPSFTSLQSLSIHPTYEWATHTPTCKVQAKSYSGRTTALLDLNWEDPTFSIIHDLDECNTIAPQISLSTSSIVYYWKVLLDQSSICTRVDPMSCIDITWRDSTSGGGTWVTQVQVPLSPREASWKQQAWKPTIGIRRTFSF